MDNEEVKKNIERIRQYKGVKIETICADLGITRQAWYNYLSGGFSLATLNKISEALSVEVWELLKPTNKEHNEQITTQPEQTITTKFVCPCCGNTLYLSTQKPDIITKID